MGFGKFARLHSLSSQPATVDSYTGLVLNIDSIEGQVRKWVKEGGPGWVWTNDSAIGPNVEMEPNT